MRDCPSIQQRKILPCLASGPSSSPMRHHHTHLREKIWGATGSLGKSARGKVACLKTGGMAACNFAGAAAAPAG